MDELNIQKSLFDMESTVSQDAAGIVRLMVLVRVDKMLIAWERYQNTQPNSGENEKYRIRTQSSIITLLSMLTARMSTREKKGYSPTEIKRFLEEKKYEDAILKILMYLEDDLKLTKIDNMRDYDRTNAELENTEKGL